MEFSVYKKVDTHLTRMNSYFRLNTLINCSPFYFLYIPFSREREVRCVCGFTHGILGTEMHNFMWSGQEEHVNFIRDKMRISYERLGRQRFERKMVNLENQIALAQYEKMRDNLEIYENDPEIFYSDPEIYYSDSDEEYLLTLDENEPLTLSSVGVPIFEVGSDSDSDLISDPQHPDLSAEPDPQHSNQDNPITDPSSNELPELDHQIAEVTERILQILRS